MVDAMIYDPRWSTIGISFGVLGKLLGANMNTTADQAIPMTATNYLVTAIYVTNASTSMTLAVGGIYPAASKAGTAVVGAGQAYSALTGDAVVLPLTLAVTSTRLTVTPLYLSLTVAQGSAATADVYVVGVVFG